MATQSPWLVPFRRNSTATRRLIAFPHAGGSASFYRPWASRLGAATELLAVQYPGRENRLSEPLLSAMDELANGAADALIPVCDRETILFGHSMGAAVAYETLRLLESAGVSQVLRLCVSGRELSGSRQPVPSGPRGNDELMRSIAELGGTQSAVLDAPDFRDMVLDIMRNDYLLIDTYQWSPHVAPLGVEVVAVAGDDDPMVDPARLTDWAGVTTGAFSRHVLPGAHFYLMAHAERVLEIATA